MSYKYKSLGELCVIEKGKVGIQKAIPGEFPLIVTAEERLSHSEYHFEGNAVVIPLVSSTGHGHKSLKRIHFQTGKFAVGNILCAVLPKDETVLNAEYLYRFLDLNREKELVGRMKGMANVSLPLKEIAQIEIPLPPVSEQIKFVEEYKQLEIEKNKLDTELAHQLDMVKQLRQAFLHEAIQGKLTEEWRANHPEFVSDYNRASQLLDKIKANKEKLIQLKKLKKGGTSSQTVSLIDDLVIPESWTTCKSDDVFFVTKLAGFEYTKHIVLQTKGDIPVVRAQNVRPYQMDKSNLLFISRETSEYLERCALTKECLLVTFIGAGIGDIARFDEPVRWHLAPNVAKLEPFEGCENLMNLKYLNYYLMSNTGQAEIFKHVKATAQPSLSMGTIRDIDFVLPPLLEQDQIVTKLDELMQYCDQLEESIKTSQWQNEMLLQQVLREALEPKEKELVA